MPDPVTPSNEGGSDSGFTPPATQDELNKIISERVQRERAKYADYKDLKSKAEKFDELEKANQTELEKVQGRATEAEAERDRALTESLRLRVAVKHGVSDEDADLFLTGTDEETLTKQAERLAQRSEDRKKQGNRVPSEGGNPQPQEDEMRTFVHGLFDGGD